MIRRPWLALVALGLVLALPATTLAVSWTPPLKITTSRNAEADDGLAVTPTRAHLVYEEAIGGLRRAWYRRTTDGGASWSMPLQLSRTSAPYAYAPRIAAAGSGVNAVWTEETTTGTWVVVHRRSSDGGATWSAPVVLSPATGDAGMPNVARDAAGVVVVAWTDSTTGAVRARSSPDGGATWKGSLTLATTTNVVDGYREGFVDLAAGSGIFYAALYTASGTVKVRRSFDAAASWTTATRSRPAPV